MIENYLLESGILLLGVLLIFCLVYLFFKCGLIISA